MQVHLRGLKEFRKALREADRAAPRQITKALKVAGQPVLVRAKELAPFREGDLRRSGKLSARGTGKSALVFDEPYAEGAEYGTRGKWKGFAKYGPRADRYAHRALDEKAEEALELLYEGMRDIATVYGWLKGR